MDRSLSLPRTTAEDRYAALTADRLPLEMRSLCQYDDDGARFGFGPVTRVEL